jgi:KaiC/GvpD/RAD55 family RecA-like ATPase
MSALRTIKAHAQYYGGVVLITMLRDVYDTTTQSGIEQLADVILEMEMFRTPKGFINYIIIKKVRNHPEKAGIFKYNITDNGIEIE